MKSFCGRAPRARTRRASSPGHALLDSSVREPHTARRSAPEPCGSNVGNVGERDDDVRPSEGQGARGRVRCSHHLARRLQARLRRDADGRGPMLVAQRRRGCAGPAPWPGESTLLAVTQASLLTTPAPALRPALSIPRRPADVQRPPKFMGADDTARGARSPPLFSPSPTPHNRPPPPQFPVSPSPAARRAADLAPAGARGRSGTSTPATRSPARPGESTSTPARLTTQ